MSSIDSLSSKIRSEFQQDKGSVSDLHALLKMIKLSPLGLNEIRNYPDLGRSLVLMLDLKITANDDILQTITSLGYLILSTAIYKEPHNYNSIKDRLVLLRLGREPFCFTIMHPLGIERSYMNFRWQDEARDAIYRMEFADLQTHSVLKQVDYLKNRNDELEKMFAKKIFAEKRPKEEVILQGNQIHEKIFNYLDQKILKEGSLDFD